MPSPASFSVCVSRWREQGLLRGLFGAGSRRARGGRDQYRGSTAPRLLAGAMVVLLVFTAFACTPSKGGNASASGAGVTHSPGAVTIPEGGQDPFLQCMLDAGWQLTQYNAAVSPPFYELSGPLPWDSAAVEREHACQSLQPNGGWPTDDEIVKIYYRWVDEYNCMVGLGYHPDPPPSVETFVASYRTGPWDPITGLNSWDWSYDEWARNRAKCTLEELPDPPLPTRLPGRDN
jgi:hypothetical protein